MSISKAWDWNKETRPIWIEPSEDSYYLADRWRRKGYKDILDFGCGLGRHSIYFAKQGFNVKAFDLSEDGVEHLKKWAREEKLHVEVEVLDMLSLSYEAESFDTIFSYHVISHTDTKGMVQIMKEIERILKPGGEIFLTLCSKDTWSFKEANDPKLDENTVIRMEEGPENGVPHFYVDVDDIIALFKSHFNIEIIRHIDNCYFNGAKQNNKHYFILAQKKRENE